MVDVQVYKETKNYEKFQYLRPDYSKSIKKSIDLAKKHINTHNEIILSDFCCGTGSNSKKFSEVTTQLKKVILIDINKDFLEIAKKSQIKTKELKIVNKNILNFSPEKESDIVFSIFAYHHVRDKEKSIYIQKVKDSLKKNGILILTEIYLPTKKLCLEYYDKVFDEIPKHKRVVGLKEFLTQTAESDDFEFKVSKKFADNQFKKSGFNLIEEIKIWPCDNSFEEDVGTFIQVYQC